jgi:hypothetical protein
MSTTRRLLPLLVAPLVLLSAVPALPCAGITQKHVGKFVDPGPPVFVMMSQIRIPGANFPVDTNILALGAQFKDAGGNVRISCMADPHCGVTGCGPADTPVQVGPTGMQLQSNAFCKSSRIVQPLCKNAPNGPCRNNTDCTNGSRDLCQCPAPGQAQGVPFAPNLGDPRIADSVFEAGGNLLCYECSIDFTGAGFAIGQKFTMPTFINIDHGPLGKTCPMSTCDGDGDGAIDPIVRTSMPMASGTVPAH